MFYPLRVSPLHEELGLNIAEHGAVSVEHDLISVLDKTTLKFSLKAGEEGKLFGSVTTQMISDELAEQGLKVDKKEITLEDSIKELGTHKVSINFGEDLSATIKVKVDEESE